MGHHYLCWTITTYVGPSLPMLDHHYLCWTITTYVGPSLPMLDHHYLCWAITTYVGPSLRITIATAYCRVNPLHATSSPQKEKRKEKQPTSVCHSPYKTASLPVNTKLFCFVLIIKQHYFPIAFPFIFFKMPSLIVVFQYASLP